MNASGAGRAVDAADAAAAAATWRQVTLYRAGTVALIGALLLTAPVVGGARSGSPWFLGLFVFAALSAAVHWVRRDRTASPMLIAESVVAGVLIAAGDRAGTPELALYVVVPAVWAGSALPIWRAVLLGPIAGWILFADQFARASAGGPPPEPQWVVLPISVTLIAALFARIEARRARPDYYYDRALSLLKQLAPVTRRLPLGLERMTLIQNCATDVSRAVPTSDLVIRTASGAGWLVEYGEPDSDPNAGPGTASWDRAVRSGRMQLGRRDRGTGRACAVVPMRRGAATVGVLTVSAPAEDLTWQGLEDVQKAASVLALQLEASNVFSGIREDATEQERVRLSRQIHDGVAQDLAALAYGLDSIAASISDQAQQDGIDAAAAEVRRLLEELRFSIFDLRTGTVGGEPLVPALADYLRQVGDRSGLRISLDMDDVSGEVAPGAAAELFRIIQESVTNARRHSGATALVVTVRRDRDGVLVRIVDDGIGIRLKGGQRAGNGVGLAIMQERARRIGADLTIASAPGRGTVVECRLPIAGPAPIETCGGTAATVIGRRPLPTPAGLPRSAA